MEKELLLLGVDGGGTRCRARLCSFSGMTLGEGLAGPANIRLGPKKSYDAVLDAASQCLNAAGISSGNRAIVACLALAGASEPVTLAALQSYRNPFRQAIYTTDAHAACVGAHRGEDGGVIIIGTGSVGHAIIDGKLRRAGGWGFPVSDEGSGAWLGCETLRRVLWAHDGRIEWTALLRHVFADFEEDPNAIVRWMSAAKPRDFGTLAPLAVEYASRNDPAGCDLMRLAAEHVEAMANRLHALGARRLTLSGGLASSVEPWLSAETRSWLVPAAADALSGAVQLARAAVLTRSKR